ncbi:MAG: hypothetical protein ACRCZI_09385 [Cetobacterium sp.]
MKKLVIIGMLLSFNLIYCSEKVFIVEKGKSYHKSKECMSLRKSKNIREVNISEVGNRKPCRIKNC